MYTSPDQNDTEAYTQVDLEIRERRRAQNRLAQRKRRMFDSQ